MGFPDFEFMQRLLIVEVVAVATEQSIKIYTLSLTLPGSSLNGEQAVEENLL